MKIFNLGAALTLLILVGLSHSAIASQQELREIPDAQEPIRFSPAIDTSMTADQMHGGSTRFISKTPWAMPHMIYKNGMIANRPLDARFQALGSTDEKYAYFLQHNLKEILEMKDLVARQKQINALSPAEKYDLAIGDLDENFSNAIWDEVENQMAQGNVPTWLGICDGSSSASVLFDEPTKKVTVNSRLKGVAIDFYVGDLKSLLSFSMTTYVAHDLPIFGTRCTGSDCVGLNPGAFHEIMMQMSEDPSRYPYMIVDRLPSNAIWNSALISGSYGYYNPQTSTAVSNNAVDHIVDVGAYDAPDGSPGWAPGTRYLLFAAATLRLSDTRTTVDYNTPGKMTPLDLSVRYILELDGKLKIIGGEWTTPQHPGFIWALPRDYQPRSMGDRDTAIFTWQGTEIPPAAMPAVLKSSRAMQPLFRVINSIYQESK